MTAITKSLFYIAILSPLTLANLYFMVADLAQGKWVAAALSAVAILCACMIIGLCYSRAKAAEKKMQDNIQTLINLQSFDLLRKAFEKYPDFNPNGFGPNPKDKKDEVATDK